MNILTQPYINFFWLSQGFTAVTIIDGDKEIAGTISDQMNWEQYKSQIVNILSEYTQFKNGKKTDWEFKETGEKR